MQQSVLDRFLEQSLIPTKLFEEIAKKDANSLCSILVNSRSASDQTKLGPKEKVSNKKKRKNRKSNKGSLFVLQDNFFLANSLVLLDFLESTHKISSTTRVSAHLGSELKRIKNQTKKLLRLVFQYLDRADPSDLIRQRKSIFLIFKKIDYLSGNVIQIFNNFNALSELPGHLLKFIIKLVQNDSVYSIFFERSRSVLLNSVEKLVKPNSELNEWIAFLISELNIHFKSVLNTQIEFPKKIHFEFKVNLFNIISAFDVCFSYLIYIWFTK